MENKNDKTQNKKINRKIVKPPVKTANRTDKRNQSKNPNKRLPVKANAEKGNNRHIRKPSLKPRPLRVVFLGGVGEIGKNMTALECGDDIIIIDAGAIFPTEETPGFDLIVPDVSYLVENAKKVRALILTHGHEDHIGGVPYLLKEMKIPVAGTKLTLALVDNKLREHRINDVKEITLSPDKKVQFGCFKVQPVNVNH